MNITSKNLVFLICLPILLLFLVKENQIINFINAQFNPTCNATSKIKKHTNIENNIFQKIQIFYEDIQESTMQEYRSPIINGIWGEVLWTWNSASKTIELVEGGIAGDVSTAPWKTYTDVIEINIRENVIFPKNSSFMFSGRNSSTWLTDLKRICNGNNIDVSNVTNFSYMFHRASKLTHIDVSNWNTSNGTLMNHMFNENHSLIKLDVSQWNISNVTNLNSMFNMALEISTLEVCNWDTSSVSNLQSVFENTANLAEINVSNWNVSQVTRMDRMFFNNLSNHQMSKLTKIDVSTWDTSKVQNMASMFAGCRSLITLDVSNWNTSNVTDMGELFAVASKIEELDLSKWDTQNVRSTASGMFRNMNNLKTLHLGNQITFLHLPEHMRPSLPEDVMPANIYSGNWVYEKDNTGETPPYYIALHPSRFFHEYEGKNTGTYVWEKIGQPITINYLDSNGTQLSDPQTITGRLGETYEIPKKVFLGWDILKIIGNTEGYFTDESQSVSIIYHLEDAKIYDPLNFENEFMPEDIPDQTGALKSLRIDYIPTLSFSRQKISVHKNKYYAQPIQITNSDIARPLFVQISDFRTTESSWQLSMEQKMQFKNNKGNELYGAEITFSKGELLNVHNLDVPSFYQKEIVLIPNETIIMIEAEEKEGRGTSIYRFGNEYTARETVYITVPEETIPERGNYMTSFSWVLRSAPNNK